MPRAMEIKNQEAGPSGHHLGEEEVDSDDVKVVYSEDPEVVESQGAHQEKVGEPESTASHLGKGIFLTSRK